MRRSQHIQCQLPSSFLRRGVQVSRELGECHGVESSFVVDGKCLLRESGQVHVLFGEGRHVAFGCCLLNARGLAAQKRQSATE